MLATSFGGSIWGVDVNLVRIEAHIDGGLPAFHMVGLPRAAVKESKERVRSAILHSGFDFPPRRIVINLAPADVPKGGSGLDLAIAVAVLAASGQLDETSLRDKVFFAELGLDGSLRPLRGCLPVALEMARRKQEALFLPEANGDEVGLVRSIDLHGPPSLRAVVDHLRGEALLPAIAPRTAESGSPEDPAPFAGLVGRPEARRALEIAAAGRHSLLLIGPPGTGKTLLAGLLPRLLPDLDQERMLEATRLHSIAGTLDPRRGPLRRPPFRSPHTTCTLAAMCGGGVPPRPGEMTLAHHGVLLLDEMPEFRRTVLESLRGPLTNGEIHVERSRCHAEFPADFQLVATMNPCPCGHLGDDRLDCICTPQAVNRYRNRISGPLLDRIDMHLHVGRQRIDARTGEGDTDGREARRRVLRARRTQAARRNGHEDVASLGRRDTSELERLCTLSSQDRRWLDESLEAMAMSHRARNKVLGLARTIADLEGADTLGRAHLAEAIHFRSLDRRIRTGRT